METLPLTRTRPHAAGAGAPRFGVAVDLGTTTIAATAWDLGLGACLGEGAVRNPQVRFGADVLTRVSHALAGGAEELRQAAVDGVRQAAVEALRSAGASADDLVETVVVGNPAMTHLLLGRDTAPLAAAPYRGALVGALSVPAYDTGLPGEMLFVGPGVSAFVGADAVAGVLALELDAPPHPSVLIDLGTNGEIVLSTAGGLLASSAAAGPAFEGVEISCGMRAEPGAVERVTLRDGRLDLGVVGDEAPAGVCGSGLLDAVAAMLDAGALDESGRLRAEGPLAARVAHPASGDTFELAPGVALTQQDVRALQLAKGAVATALDMLLEEAGVAPGDIARVFVAGAFGSNAGTASLARLGILPDAWADRVVFAGNTALAGAEAMLLHPEARERATRLALAIRTVPLAIRPDFQTRFLARLGFPDGPTRMER